MKLNVYPAQKMLPPPPKLFYVRLGSHTIKKTDPLMESDYLMMVNSFMDSDFMSARFLR